MSTIDTLASGNSGLASMLNLTKAEKGDDSKVTPSALTPPAATEGIKVSLSGAGIQKASGPSGKNRDIEESGLPNDIQHILKMIRKLQQQIAEKLAQMQAVMADNRLSPEEVKAKVGSLQAAISGLNAGLITANTALAKAIKQAELSPDQVLKTMSLAMKS
ncbi:hypothetical protein [Pseudomonas izuensis]|uniref:hypothetical protein n=1 Tax=Pseudomonas izuensis TaxID=2684212 RepID=UPI0013573964|nr:hypothetical protein [Pseudomonas izuensis]